MKYLALSIFLLVASCASVQPNLPRGSYAYADGGYTEDKGTYGEAGVRIPLYQK